MTDGQSASLFERVMGERFAALPAAVRDMHDAHGHSDAVGEGTVEGGNGTFSGVLCRIMRFPQPGSYPLRVSFSERGGAETWTRDFDGHRFRSILCEHKGKLTESFGPIRFTFDLPSSEAGLRMVLRGWSMFGVPLPLTFWPRIDAREWEEDGRFRFALKVSFPLAGPLISYSGWLRRVV